jgi:hypothetical protein
MLANHILAVNWYYVLLGHSFNLLEEFRGTPCLFAQKSPQYFADFLKQRRTDCQVYCSTPPAGGRGEAK